jgi:glycosyltransferase involved in cell wall biosynthesis
MKFLVVCSIFPPDAMGGAELSAHSCARWLIGQGHEVSVLTTAKVRSDEIRGIDIDGMKIWRLFWPRLYPIHTHADRSSIRKIVWHLEDHFHPANPKILTEIIEEVQPDFINLHLVAGIGHNALSALKQFPNIPIIYFLHDLGLACIRSTMFRSGVNCEKKCVECRASSLLKFTHLHKENIFTFVSPSAANLKTLDEQTPLKGFCGTVVPNFDFETPLFRVNRVNGTPLRFIFVGRLHHTKGVSFLLSVFNALAAEGHSFHVKIVGGGPEEKSLRQAYQQYRWVTFAGRLAPSLVKSEMSAADVLCVPSLWRENHPGVVRQALRAGVPALVSDTGGSAEMIDNGLSGMVLRSADREAWKSVLLQLILNENLVERLQNGAVQSARKYEVDVVGRQLSAVIQSAMERVHRYKGAFPAALTA